MILLINPLPFDAIAEGSKEKTISLFCKKKYKNKRTIKNSLSFIFWDLRQITLLNFQRMVI
ncbi:hypothetical protein DPE81_21385 [Salmonella enterica subsp. enterica]|nr:hypothetical protein [Salmonella enterica]ECI4111490.1 hypothetical protein [Salmonella enterica subsp. enterica]